LYNFFLAFSFPKLENSVGYKALGLQVTKNTPTLLDDSVSETMKQLPAANEFTIKHVASRGIKVGLLISFTAGMALATTGPKTVIAKTTDESSNAASSLSAPSTLGSAKSKSARRKSSRRKSHSVQQTANKVQQPVAAAKYAKAKTRSSRRSSWRELPPVDPTIGDDTRGEDPVVRQAAIEAIGNVAGSMVVVDPNTGRVLTIVNQKLALSGYQPCSTFKPAVALAALEEGVIENEHTRLRLGNKWYMDLKQSLAHSNNVYFAKLGTLLGLNRLRHYGQSFGFGEQAGLGILEEPSGKLPLEPPPASEGGVGKVASFGQGISQTPLQLVSFVSAVANGGTLYYLQYPKTIEEQESFAPRVKRKLDIGPWLEPVRQGMLEAVLFGTARRAHQPDVTILGKTGTCSQDGMKLGWFAGYTQLERGLAVAVLQRTLQPMGGGPHAAEIAGRLFRKLSDQHYFANFPEKPTTVVGTPSAVLVPPVQ
jgi:penicillin-binding protein 2